MDDISQSWVITALSCRDNEFNEIQDSNIQLAQKRCYELISFISCFAQDIMKLSINGKLFFNYEDHEIEIFNDPPQETDVPIQDQYGLNMIEPINIIAKIDVSKNHAKYEKERRKISITLDITMNHLYPNEIPKLDIIKSVGMDDIKKSQLLEIFNEHCDKNRGSEMLYGLFFNARQLIRLLDNISTDDTLFKTEAGKQLLCQITHNPTTINDLLNQKLAIDQVSTVSDKGIFAAKNFSMIKINVKLEDLSSIIANSENIHKPLNNYHVIIDEKFVQLKLFRPVSKTNYYKYGPLEFTSNFTDYMAVEEKNMQAVYRVSIYEYNFAPIANSFPDLFPHLHENISMLLHEFKEKTVQKMIQERSDEHLSKYFYGHYLWLHINENVCSNFPRTTLQFIMVKEPFPEDSYKKFKEFKQMLSSFNISVNNDPNISRYILRILSALKNLHHLEQFYGDFDPDKIFFSMDGLVKLFDPCLDTWISILVPAVIEQLFEAEKTPRILNQAKHFWDNFIKHQIKSLVCNDIFNFGSLVLSMKSDFEFVPVFNYFNNSIDISELIKLINESLMSISDEHLHEVIRLCIDPDENNRCSLDILLDHRFFKQCMMNSGICVDAKTIAQPAKLSLDNGNSIPFSRLQDFHILETFGKGGFGRVLRVRNKLDNFLYAIKVIKLRDETNRIMREVINLSKMNHENVVRYYSSWIDVFKFRKEDDDDDDDSSEISIISKEEPDTKPKEPSPMQKVLCIQMELCQRDTLKNLIDSKKTHADLPLKNRIFLQIVEGLNYVHHLGIIHRDLKPSNIFFDKENRVKIGDFGISREDGGSRLMETTATSHKKTRLSPFTYETGTSLYMAPENHWSKVAQGRNPDQKIDIYALGIIFLEMSYPFKTTNEQIRFLLQFRNYHRYPSDIKIHVNEDDLNMISKLTSVKASDRPTSSELLSQLKAKETSYQLPHDEQNIIKILMDSFDSNSLKKKLFEQLFSADIPFHTGSYPYDPDSLFVSSNQFHYKLAIFNFCCSIFKLYSEFYGPVQLSFPSLVPKNLLHQTMTDDICYVLDKNGFVLSLPHDMRVQFARYLVANPHLKFVRKVSIEKIFVRGHHENQFSEKWEAALDLVFVKYPTDNSCILPYAEILGFAIQLLPFFLAPFRKTYIDHTPVYYREIECYQSQVLTIDKPYKFVFSMTNLTVLLKLCDFLRMSPQNYSTIINLLTVHNMNIKKDSFNEFKLAAKVELKNVSDETLNILVELLSQTDSNAEKFFEKIRVVLCRYYQGKKVKKFLSTKLKPLIKEMEMISQLSSNYHLTTSSVFDECFGFKFSLSHLTKNSLVFNHIIVDVFLEIDQEPLTLIAVGGKYDNLIESLRIQTLIKEDDQRRSGIGITFDMEKLCQLIETSIVYKTIKNSHFPLLMHKKKMLRKFSNFVMNTPNGSRFSMADLIIVPLVPTNHLFNIKMSMNPICVLVNKLRSQGFSVILLPEMMIEKFECKVSTPQDEPYQQFFEMALKHCIDSVLIVDVASIGQDNNVFFYYQQHLVNIASQSSSADTQNWSLTKFEEIDMFVGHLVKSDISNQSMSPEMRELSPSSKEIRSIGSSSPTSTLDNMQSSYNIDFICDSNEGQVRRRYMTNLMAELKKLSFINFGSKFKVLAVNFPFSIIKTISEKVIPAEISSSSPLDPTVDWIANEVSYCESSRDHTTYSCSIRKAIRSICSFFASKYNERSRGSFSAVILISYADKYQYRIIA